MTETPVDDFLSRLAASQPGLSPKMATLGRFLSEHYVEAAFMTTRQIAAAGGVSHATVVRFPGVLGYRDFDSLRDSIRDRVNMDLTAVERIRVLSADDCSASALFHRAVNAEVENLTALAHSFSEAQIERFVQAVLPAEQVIIVGFRYASPLALYFGYSLGKIRPNVHAFMQADSSIYDRVHLMAEDDVVIAVVFARYPADLLSLLRYAHGLGRRILAITDSPLSPVLPLADVALFARTSVLDFVGSLGAPAALINCIVSELRVRLGEDALRRLEALEDAAERAMIYVRA